MGPPVRGLVLDPLAVYSSTTVYISYHNNSIIIYYSLVSLAGEKESKEDVKINKKIQKAQNKEGTK